MGYSQEDIPWGQGITLPVPQEAERAGQTTSEAKVLPRDIYPAPPREEAEAPGAVADLLPLSAGALEELKDD